ncbi:unnamed protein product [Closterium sp. Yama58-4]|nr:unnamed protein product [Closterium sp. Yama58-4]
MGVTETFVCLAFNFTLCSVLPFSPTTLLMPAISTRAGVAPSRRGCDSSELSRVVAVVASAVQEHYSVTRIFCNDDFCYNFPRIKNRFRRSFASDPDGNPAGQAFLRDALCGELYLKRGARLFPMGAPMSQPVSIMLRDPVPPLPLADESRLSLCLRRALLPPLPFFVPLVAPPTALDQQPKKKGNRGTMMPPGGGGNVMTRQFNEVMINLGVQQVNQQKFDEAINTFTLLLDELGNSAPALIGRGTAYALSGKIKEAIEDYSLACELEPKMVDAWRRRAQARAAIGEVDGAIEDFTTALSLEKGQMDLLMERGMVYARARRFYEAAKDLRAVVAVMPKEEMAHVALAESLVGLGETEEAMEIYEKVVDANPGNRMAWLYMGQAAKELAMPDRAEQAYRKATQLEPRFAQAYRVWALLKHAMGDHKHALELVRVAMKLEPENVEGHYIKGSCHHALGQLQDAVTTYDGLLSKPTRQEEQPLLFMAFYQREVAQFTASRLNKPLRDFDFEDNFGPEFKQAWARRSVPTDLFPAYRPQPYRAAFDNQMKPEKHMSEQVKRGRKELVKAADTVGARTQYTSPGFLPNQRQHRAAGMAALEMMQAARATCREPWPCDPIVWVDQLTQEEFEKGFGAVTAMVQGHSKNLRYYANYDRAFALIRDEMLEQGAVEIGDLTQKYEIPVEMDAEVEAAETPEELWNVVGQNFLITVPCFSTAKPDYMLNGTTLAIRKLGDGAFDFAIKMPLTPPRWKEYDAELTAAWKNLCEVMADAKKSKDDKLVKTAILRVVYYWYNFSPLSRGSAMAGYSSLLGLFLAAGKEITAKPPPDVQVDWEAILSPTLEEFISRISKWLFVGATDAADFHDLLDVHEAFPTQQRMASYPSAGRPQQPPQNLQQRPAQPLPQTGAAKPPVKQEPGGAAGGAGSAGGTGGSASASASAKKALPPAACSGCGATGGDLSQSECGHMSLCNACGRSMAEKQATCQQCGAVVDKLVKEFLVRVKPVSRDYFIGKFPQGLPGLKKGDERGWTMKREGVPAGRVLSEAARAKARTRPLLLEDDTGQASYVGHMEGGWQHSAYYLLVMHGKEFVAIPASQWYAFTKQAQYKTLTLEEAELCMQSKRRKADGFRRWLTKEESEKLLAGGGKEGGGEDWEHDELFSDDDEATAMQPEDKEDEKEQERSPTKEAAAAIHLADKEDEKEQEWSPTKEKGFEFYFAPLPFSLFLPPPPFPLFLPLRPSFPSPLSVQEEEEEEEEEEEGEGQAEGEGGALSLSGKALKKLLHKAGKGKGAGAAAGGQGAGGGKGEGGAAAASVAAGAAAALSAAAAAAAAAAGRGLKRKDLEKGTTGGGASGAAAAGAKKGKVEPGKRTPPLPAKREPGAGGAAAGKAGGGTSGGGASGAAAAGPKPTAVTEEAVKGILRQAPIKSADLVNRFRSCLKTAEDKKRFQEIIKRVGKIQAVNGEKFIVLR